MPELADARWFAVDLHVPSRNFRMLAVDDDAIDRSSFLDNRIDAKLADATPLDAARVEQLPRAPLGWLFHTSFCASTLLARALHAPPFAVALKEPLVLRRLSDARDAGASLDAGLVERAVALLARPWHPGGAVVIKPTHVALNIAGDLLTAAPDSRAIILTSSLPEFLISNLKKPAESQDKIPVLVERALKATAFGQRLPAPAFEPPDPVCAAGLQWAAQRELVLDVLTALGPTRVRALDMQPLLDDLAGTVISVARWLGHPAPDDALIQRANTVGARNAKAMATPYGPARRAQEAAIVVQHYRDAIVHAQRWMQAHVLPAMRSGAAAATPTA